MARLPSENPRNQRFTFYGTLEEREIIVAEFVAAKEKQRGLSMSDFLLGRVLDGPVSKVQKPPKKEEGGDASQGGGSVVYEGPLSPKVRPLKRGRNRHAG